MPINFDRYLICRGISASSRSWFWWVRHSSFWCCHLCCPRYLRHHWYFYLFLLWLYPFLFSWLYLNPNFPISPSVHYMFDTNFIHASIIFYVDILLMSLRNMPKSPDFLIGIHSSKHAQFVKKNNISQFHESKTNNQQKINHALLAFRPLALLVFKGTIWIWRLL